ncbi:chromosomal replication initiator DnaA [Rhodomicrobium vannielii ATCC 17100]|uniref:chromosomal replication initiator DnaA n=1 Tax=Rhodomicrobium vannielii TaxID=1069 RepID=UPI00191B4AD0|nr:chromosomal replication initiator DnaA [Rhodomicrobium vannielii]MBJ7535303.1 chromosomal replication initiator DnaA [Rhodomicrobium vannielii ATCC 17100]
MSNALITLASYQAMLAASALAEGVSYDVVAQPRRRRAATRRARYVGLYLAATTLGVSQAQVARFSGVSRQAVSRICMTVEDWRDDPVIDAHIAKLEEVFQ